MKNKLTKFILDYKIQWEFVMVLSEWDNSFLHNDVQVWVPFDLLKEFSEIIGYRFINNHNPKCVLGDGCVIFTMSEIFEYHNLELEQVFGLDLKEGVVYE